MKFLIQKIDNKVVHDFSFTLLESIRYQNWLANNQKTMIFKNIYCHTNDKVYFFNPYHQYYVPVGSVEFVTAWFQKFYNHIPQPINVPKELFNYPSFDFTMRKIFNGDHRDIKELPHGKYFVKSNANIKGFTEILKINDNFSWSIPVGNYQISEYVDIQSEWRVFVYQDKFVGLQNYSGDFKKFPDVYKIKEMIKAYKDAPIAYTLDVGVGKSQHHKKYGFFLGNDTFIIEVHDFFSCGLYGFADHKIYPYMLYRWHNEYINKIKNGK